jgi:hypothetical protein
MDLEETFSSIGKEGLWIKMRQKGISDDMVECVKGIQNGTKFCEKCGDDEVKDFAKQGRGVQKICDLSSNVLNIFIVGVIDCVIKGNGHISTVGKI